MARSSEKAMAMLNRWHQLKRDVAADTPARRPRIVDEVDTIRGCERWRHQVIREVARKIAEIQNASLGEHRIRDLNDEINKLLREKERWETRIVGLGGPDYRTSSANSVEAMGLELSAHSGRYKYFGVAKELPGVKELFEQQQSIGVTEKVSIAQLSRSLEHDYYGWRDEEAEDLLPAEKKREEELFQLAKEQWHNARKT